MNDLTEFLTNNPACVCVEITTAIGSTPRSAGVKMLVSSAEICGTIGGGQLEYLAIDEARRMLRQRTDKLFREIALGPELGQCCGGGVMLDFFVLTEQSKLGLLEEANSNFALLPSVFLFGAGHVGRALTDALALLPVKTTVVETRKNELEVLEAAHFDNKSVACIHTPLPEQVVADAPANSAFVVFTHDHALDYLITSAALKRDAAYVGIIGSKTKRTLFHRFHLQEGGVESELKKLSCPIGGTTSDKRPQVIAALTAGEIVQALEFVEQDTNIWQTS